MNLEQTAPTANPDPAHLLVPAGFAQQDVQNAINTVGQDSTGNHRRVPAGRPVHAQRAATVYGKAVKIVGAGVWYTQFVAPQGQTNTDTGWDVQSTASGSSFSGFAWFGNYTTRDRRSGPHLPAHQRLEHLDRQHLDRAQRGRRLGPDSRQNSSFTNMRIRDTLADGINLTNGSTGQHDLQRRGPHHR